MFVRTALVEKSALASNIAVLLVLDWSSESSCVLQNFIEARKKLLMDYMLDVSYSVIELENANLKLRDHRPPIMVINGKIVFENRVPSVDEIIRVILYEDHASGEQLGMDILCEIEKPIFGAAATSS